jgi:DAACS family dicarboxylate/amino acid:cation (Na+ or H+) symporter
MHADERGAHEGTGAGEQRRRIPLHTRILLGLAFGAAAGIGTNLFANGAPWVDTLVTYVAQPVGQIFLGMLFMVVMPLVFTTLALGVAGLGDLSKLGRIGGKTIAFFVITTACAVVLGLTLANLVEPGATIDPAVRAALLTEYSSQAADRVATSESNGFGIQTFINIVPRNPIRPPSMATCSA